MMLSMSLFLKSLFYRVFFFLLLLLLPIRRPIRSFIRTNKKIKKTKNFVILLLFLFEYFTVLLATIRCLKHLYLLISITIFHVW